jgi:hypothetical protein
MNAANSQFETGRMDNYKRDYYKSGYAWSDDRNIFWRPRSKKFEYTNSTETSENSEGFVFRINLTEISRESLKIIPAKNYIIVQSNKKTIFISLNHRIRPETLSRMINGDMLIISVKKYNSKKFQ